jgi:hypothetical protein
MQPPPPSFLRLPWTRRKASATSAGAPPGVTPTQKPLPPPMAARERCVAAETEIALRSQSSVEGTMGRAATRGPTPWDGWCAASAAFLAILWARPVAMPSPPGAVPLRGVLPPHTGVLHLHCILAAALCSTARPPATMRVDALLREVPAGTAAPAVRARPPGIASSGLPPRDGPAPTVRFPHGRSGLRCSRTDRRHPAMWRGPAGSRSARTMRSPRLRWSGSACQACRPWPSFRRCSAA